MTKATRLIPPKPRTPQCVASLSNIEALNWRQRTTDPKYKGVGDRCLFQSSYKIDGKCYCGRHAPMVALQIILKEGRGK